MEMIEYLNHFLETDNTKLIYFLALIIIANLFDTLMGWLNAKFNKDVQFSTSMAMFGIAKKIVYFMLLVYFIPIVLLLPEPIGITALYGLYTAYLLSEIQSVLTHLNISSDEKKNKLFIGFIENVFNPKK